MNAFLRGERSKALLRPLCYFVVSYAGWIGGSGGRCLGTDILPYHDGWWREKKDIRNSSVNENRRLSA